MARRASVASCSARAVSPRGGIFVRSSQASSAAPGRGRRSRRAARARASIDACTTERSVRGKPRAPTNRTVVMAVMTPRDPFGRAALRTVLTVVARRARLYLIYLLRKPITWLVIAAFIAVAMSGPVNVLQRHMKRGLAIALAYAALVMIPIALGALMIPSMVDQIENLAENVPRVRPGRHRLRQRQRHAQRPQRQVRLHERDPERRRRPAEQDRRRRGHAPGHRRRPRQLDLRRGDDPDPEHLHGRRRSALGGGVRALAAVRPARARRARAAAHRRTRSETTSPARCCRRRSPAFGVHRPDDPRGAVRRPAGADRRLLRPDPGRRRDDRRGADRDRDAVRQLPGRG